MIWLSVYTDVSWLYVVWECAECVWDLQHATMKSTAYSIIHIKSKDLIAGQTDKRFRWMFDSLLINMANM